MKINTVLELYFPSKFTQCTGARCSGTLAKKENHTFVKQQAIVTFFTNNSTCKQAGIS
jgi:hypothetical protein